jgi:hypothetical protein
MSVSNSHNILREIDFNQIILNKLSDTNNTKTNYLLLVDEENLERLNHIIEKYQKHLDLVRGKYKKKNEGLERKKKTKEQITYKVVTSF